MALEDTIQKEMDKFGGMLTLGQKIESNKASDLDRAGAIEEYIHEYVPDTDKPVILNSYYSRPLPISARETLGSIGAKTKEFGDTRYPEIKEALVNYTLEQINTALNGAKEKGEAAQVLAQILRPVLNIQEPALQPAVQEFSKRTGYSPAYLTQESHQILRNQVIEMTYRSAASDYLIEEGKGYQVNQEKLEKLFEDVRQGSLMYEVTKQLEKINAETAKEAKKLKIAA